MSERPRVTFGMIVLNGLPFLPYNLRALYPYAHQIVVVEGAAPGAAAVATAEGHSLDGTLDELRRFAADEDPDGKLVVVTAEDEGHADGFWPGEKDEQSRAYAARATGDYLWQVDVDEFYLPGDLEAVLELLASRPTVTAVTFPTITLWGAPWCEVDGWFLRRGNGDYHRLFKWGPGYSYARHRPPTVLDDQGRDTRAGLWLDAAEMKRRGIVMQHFSLLLPRQVHDKVDYYANWGVDARRLLGRRWIEDSYLTLRRPYHVHNVYQYPSWLQRYEGPHPPEVERMVAALAGDGRREELRAMADVERLLDSQSYAVGRELLKWAEPLDRWARQVRWSAAPYVRRVFERGPRLAGRRDGPRT
jgi:hypothetical protein